MRRISSLQIGLLAGLALTAAARGEFDLSWSSIDGGGLMYSTGGGFRLGGTIGQPDAGPRMTGGSFRLTGGFWVVGRGTPCDGCVGDLDHDCDVGLQDLTILLANFGVPSGATPDQGDLDGDGDVALQDLTILLANFGTLCG